MYNYFLCLLQRFCNFLQITFPSMKQKNIKKRNIYARHFQDEWFSVAFFSINFRILNIFLKKKKEKKKQAAAMGEHYLPSAKLYTDGHLFIQQCENL